MARLTTGSAGMTIGTQALPKTAGSIVFWMVPSFNWTDAGDNYLFYAEDGAGGWFRILRDHNWNFHAGWSTGELTYGLPITAGVRMHIGVTWVPGDEVDSVLLYADGQYTQHRDGSFTPVDTNSARTIGDNTQTTEFAEFAIFDRRLTAAEIGTLFRGASPMDFLPVDYAPLWGVHDPEPNLLGRTPVTINSATRTNHPPVSPFPTRFRRGIHYEDIPQSFKAVWASPFSHVGV